LRRAPSWRFTWPSFMWKVAEAIQSTVWWDSWCSREVLAPPRRSQEGHADMFPSLTSSAGRRKFRDTSPLGVATNQTLIPGMHLKRSRLLPPGKQAWRMPSSNSSSKTVQARPKIWYHWTSTATSKPRHVICTSWWDTTCI
jgi:hypothetical protein